MLYKKIKKIVKINVRYFDANIDDQRLYWSDVLMARDWSMIKVLGLSSYE